MTVGSEQVSQVPSKGEDLLRELLGKRLIRLTRYSWWPKEEIPGRCQVQPSDSFSLTAGPLGMIFEGGETLGIASDPSLNSIIIWMDRARDGSPLRDPPLDEDADSFPVEADDRVFSEPGAWAAVLDGTLTGASLFRMKSASARKEALPSEVALCLRFGSRGALIAVHGLHDGSDDFAVLRSDRLSSAIRDCLHEVTLL